MYNVRSTADLAIRVETEQGIKVGGRSHLEKGIERLRQLERIVAEENLNTKDKVTALREIKRLKDAVNGALLKQAESK